MQMYFQWGQMLKLPGPLPTLTPIIATASGKVVDQKKLHINRLLFKSLVPSAVSKQSMSRCRREALMAYRELGNTSFPEMLVASFKCSKRFYF